MKEAEIAAAERDALMTHKERKEAKQREQKMQAAREKLRAKWRALLESGKRA